MSVLLFAQWIFGVASGASLGVWVHWLLVLSLVALALAVALAARKKNVERGEQ